MVGQHFVLRLDVLVDGQIVDSELIDHGKAKVGTLASSDVRLNQAGVSTIHAVIERQGPKAFVLSDLGSAEGTYVNRQRVQRQVIQNGDEIRFGSAVVRASIVDRESAQRQVAGLKTVANAPQQITLADGTVVSPFSDSGYYDDGGNYIPGYYDEKGEYKLGYGYIDETGQWTVVYGYYDTQGDWVDTDGPVSSIASPGSKWLFSGISDRKVYQDSYFANQGGDIVEIAQIWEDSVLSVSSFREGQIVTLSADPATKASFIVDSSQLPGDPFVLVDTTSSPQIRFGRQMTASLSRAGRQMTVEEGLREGLVTAQGDVYALAFDRQTSASVDVGDVTFVIHYTEHPAVVLAGSAFDYSQLGYFAFSAFIHIMFLLLALTIPPNSDALNLDGFGADDRFAELLVQAEEEKPPEDPDYLDGDGDDKGKADKEAENTGESGGDSENVEESEEVGELPADASDEQIEMKRIADTKVAMDSGIMKAFGGGGMGAAFGMGGSAVGASALAAIGAISDSGGAAAAGEARGFGGVGLTGAGRSGVGAGEKGFGMGSVGTLGRGGTNSGTGKGNAYGKKAANLGERNARIPKIVPGRPTVEGSLDREIIARVIRQHRNEIKFCYEKELQKNKKLAGRITVSFTIAASGSVIIAKVKSSTIKNASVENCVTGKIRRWVFPAPKGGGIVKVNYPFNFSS